MSPTADAARDDACSAPLRQDTAVKHAIDFRNRDIPIAGLLYLPDGFDAAASYAALVIATPGSSVKEQIGAIYAAKLAAQGFVVLTFDPSCQGESGGKPRDLEDPALRVEDLRCAVDCLVTLPYVDETRLGVLGICAGGGYAIAAALTEHRFRAVGTVVASDIGRSFRRMQSREALLQTLADVGRQRTAEARGRAPRRDPWIPDRLAEAHAAGVDDPDVLAAVAFYREPPHRHPNAHNRLLFTSFGAVLGFDGFHLVPELLVQPLQVVVGGRRGSTGQYEAGQTLFELAPNPANGFCVVDGAGHYDLYHVPAYVDAAIATLAPFYAAHLGDRRRDAPPGGTVASPGPPLDAGD